MSPTTSAPAHDGPAAADVPVVAPRQPCPCGSGKRYKLCHGRGASAAANALVLRPFAGLAGEADWVAMREFVPAATTAVTLREDLASVPGVAGDPALEALAGTTATLATVLPGAVSGMRRVDGGVVVGLQTAVSSGDASRDVADALLRAAVAEPGTVVETAGLPGPGPRLQDLLADADVEVVVHGDFGFWTADGADDLAPQARAALDEASAAVDPVEAVPGARAAYWTLAGGRELLRWVLPHDETELTDALGRLGAQRAVRAGGSASGEGQEGSGLVLVPGSRFLGAFRAHGLLVPVWELPAGTGAAGLTDATRAFTDRLAAALAATAPLDADERRARAGVVSRQLTLR